MAEKMRLDKWLWAARFFKTRSQAAAAISGGKVHTEGGRVKPGRAIVVGEVLRIRKGPYEFAVEVLQLSSKRGSASDASVLYSEFAESVKQRAEIQANYRAMAAAQPDSKGRPTKRDRRQIVAFKKNSDL